MQGTNVLQTQCAHFWERRPRITSNTSNVFFHNFHLCFREKVRGMFVWACAFWWHQTVNQGVSNPPMLDRNDLDPWSGEKGLYISPKVCLVALVTKIPGCMVMYGMLINGVIW